MAFGAIICSEMPIWKVHFWNLGSFLNYFQLLERWFQKEEKCLTSKIFSSAKFLFKNAIFGW